MKKNGATFIRFAMKLNLILFMMLVAFSGTLLAKNSEAQLLENKRVSVTCQNEPLDQCLKKIEQESGVSFAYDYNQVKNYKVSYFSFKNEKLGKVLSVLLSSTSLMLKEQSGVIIIFKPKSIPAARLFSSIPAGPGRITGVVMDATNKNTLSGVTVRVPGSTKATTTDGDGRYILTLEPGTYTLYFSFIGYQSVEMSNIMRRSIKILIQAG